MPELLVRAGCSIGFVNLVSFAFMADERPGIGFVLEDAADHGGVPQIFLDDQFLFLRQPLSDEMLLHQRRCFVAVLVQHGSNGFYSLAI